MQGPHYALLADAIVILHLIIVVFAVGGQAAIILGHFLRWGWIRNPVFRIVHCAVIAFVAVQALIGMWCPLTIWEHTLRKLAGQAVEEDISFVPRLVRMIIFYDLPPSVFTVVYVALGLLVIYTFFSIPPRFQQKRGVPADAAR